MQRVKISPLARLYVFKHFHPFKSLSQSPLWKKLFHKNRRDCTGGYRVYSELSGTRTTQTRRESHERRLRTGRDFAQNRSSSTISRRLSIFAQHCSLHHIHSSFLSANQSPSLPVFPTSFFLLSPPPRPPFLYPPSDRPLSATGSDDFRADQTRRFLSKMTVFKGDLGNDTVNPG